MFIDTHCHLQDKRTIARVDEILRRASDAGVNVLVCCGCREDDWDDVITLARKYDCIIPALGLHPWWAGERSPSWKKRLEGYLEQFPEMAVGEIGLDHAVDGYDEDDQIALFTEQMNIALAYDRPVSIHCRKAWGSIAAFFRQYPDTGKRAVIHSYSGSVELIDELRKYGIMFSFSGSVTFPNNRRGRKAAAAVPEELLLLETDSPDIRPYGSTGDNEPANLKTVAETVAQLRGLSVARLAMVTTSNASTRFRHQTMEGK